jgi:hypothetical protein
LHAIEVITADKTIEGTARRPCRCSGLDIMPAPIRVKPKDADMAAGRAPESILLVGVRGDTSDASFAQRSSLPEPIGMSGTEAGRPEQPRRLLWPLQSAAEPPTPTLHRTPEGQARGLTVSEVSMASSLFGNSIDYRRVKVHNETYLPFGLQPDDTAMTPNGELYFNPKRFKEDFSLSSFLDSHWFMHEMVHVWQHQLGYPVMLRGAIRIGLGYEYTLDATKRLSDYNMEAQGNLLSDHWAVSQFVDPPSLWEPKHRHHPALYRQVLAGFVADPSDKKNLPG